MCGACAGSLDETLDFLTFARLLRQDLGISESRSCCPGGMASPIGSHLPGLAPDKPA